MDSVLGRMDNGKRAANNFREYWEVCGSQHSSILLSALVYWTGSDMYRSPIDARCRVWPC